MFWLVCLIPTLPLAVAHWLGLLGHIQYSFLPFSFVLVAFWYWQRAEGTVSRPDAISSWTVVALGLIAVLIGALIAFPWFGVLGFVLIGATALASVRGVTQRSLVGLIAPLLAISLPLGLTDAFTNWVNRKTAWLSSIFLDYFEMPHSVSGSVIRLFESEVVTSRICGGLVAFPFILFLAFALLAWKRMSLWLLPVYAVAAVVTTLALNSLRLVASVIAAESMEMDLTEGWYPYAMSVIAGLIGFGMLYSFHHLFAIAFHYVEPNTDAGSNPFTQFWNKFSWMNENRALEEFSRSNKRGDSRQVDPELPTTIWYGFIGTAAVIALLSLVGAFRGESDDIQTMTSTGPLFTPTDTFFADVETNDAIKFDQYETTASGAEANTVGSGSGRRDDTWAGEFRDGKVTLQIMQPVSGWYELSLAYRTNGWEIIDRDSSSVGLALAEKKDSKSRASRENRDGSSSDAAEEVDESLSAFATARMRRTDGSEMEGYLYYSAVGSDGKVLKTPTSMGALWQNIRRRLGLNTANGGQPTALIQLLMVSQEKLSPRDIRTLQREFVKHRSVVIEAMGGEASATEKLGLKEQASFSPSPNSRTLSAQQRGTQS